MKVLQVIWTDPAWHSTLVFTSQILSEQGASVTILHRKLGLAEDFIGPIAFGSNVSLRPFGSGTEGWGRRMDYLAFARHTRKFVMELQPDVVIGYDIYGFVAAALATRKDRRSKLIYHNFDLVPNQPAGVFMRVLKLFELKASRRASCVIFSSAGRATAFHREARLIREPLIVKNCQRINAPKIKTGALDAMKRDKGPSFIYTAVRLGSMGPGHGIEATIRSVAMWRSDCGLVLAGACSAAYLAALKDLVSALRLDERIIVLPSVSQSMWYDCLYSADLGIAMYEFNGNINHEHMAGAGNKLNLYLKAGIPGIVSNIPDFIALLEQYDIGRVADPTQPESIAAAVNDILGNSDVYASLCANARRAFVTEFNFEQQFGPLLAELVQPRGPKPSVAPR